MIVRGDDGNGRDTCVEGMGAAHRDGSPYQRGMRIPLIVVADLEQVDSFRCYAVDQAVLEGESSAPHVAG